ncbi:MAG: glycosyltransferase [Geminicoccaceae bacterium]
MGSLASSPETVVPLAGSVDRGDKPIHVAQIVDSLVTGGAERLIVTFVEAAQRRTDLKVSVIVLADDRTPLRDDLERFDVEIVALPHRSLADPRRLWRMILEIRQRRIDLLHAHLSTAIIMGGLSALALRLPLVATIHNTKPSVRRVGRARAWLHRYVLRRRANRLIAVGEAVVTTNAEEAGNRPFDVVHNAVSRAAVGAEDQAQDARAELGIAPDALLLIAVGSLIPQKAHDDLLKAFARVRRQRPDARLLIVGAGPLEDDLRELLTSLELESSAALLGLRTDVPRLLAASDMFVSASHWEGTPVALLEAMVNHLPCVVTDVGDNRLLLGDTGNIAVPAEAPYELAAAIVDLASEPERMKACGQAAGSRATSAVGVDAWLDRLVSIYRHEIACGGSPIVLPEAA